MSLAKLGEGPFQILEVFDPEYASYGGTSARLPEPTDTLGKSDYEFRCACCGSKLTWRVLVQSATSNLAYIVGLTCANRAENGIDVVKLNTLKNRARTSGGTWAGFMCRGICWASITRAWLSFRILPR